MKPIFCAQWNDWRLLLWGRPNEHLRIFLVIHVLEVLVSLMRMMMTKCILILSLEWLLGQIVGENFLVCFEADGECL